MRWPSLHDPTWEHEYLRSRLFRQCRLGSQEAIVQMQAQGYPLASLFRYRSDVRRLILDFKVGGSWQSGQALVAIFKNEISVQEWVADADAIMPVPSSFWGRWRGKHDLAFALAEGLSQELRIPLHEPPWSSYLKWRKQSFLSRSQRQLASGINASTVTEQDGLPPVCDQPDAPHIVLIDDIVTTANTLTAFAGAFRNIRFRFLTLASAYHSPKAF